MRNKRKLHTLKIEKRWLAPVIDGTKKAELRVNDRDYQIGDLIHFTDINGYEYDGEFNLFIITHILPIRKVKIEESKLDDYVVLSIDTFETHKSLYDAIRGR